MSWCPFWINDKKQNYNCLNSIINLSIKIVFFEINSFEETPKKKHLNPFLEDFDSKTAMLIYCNPIQQIPSLLALPSSWFKRRKKPDEFYRLTCFFANSRARSFTDNFDE